MKVTAIALLLFAVFPAVLDAGAAQRNPRLETIALRTPDMSSAGKALVRLTDLTTGWSGGAVRPNNSSAPDCTSQNFSPYTITGQAEADYRDGGTLLISVANLFPTTAESTGDFHVGTKPGTATCEGEAFRRALGPATRLVSAHQVAAPGVGERSAHFRYVLKLGRHTFYSDVIQFVRGRALAAVISINLGQPLARSVALARVMDRRLRVSS